MESKRSALGAHKHHIAADADEAAAVKKVKSISVTSIFKQQAKKTKSLNAAPQINLGATSPVARDEPVRKVNTSKLLSSSRSPHKSSSRASKKRLDPHPLLVEFKDVSKVYRSDLYNNAAETIQADLNTLLHKLHEGTTVETVHSDVQTDSTILPIRTSIPSQYERVSKCISSPLSEYTARSAARARSEEESIGVTIHERFLGFDEQIRTQTKEIKKLQVRWEAIVREIFKLGVTCLGEDTMTSLLLPTSAVQPPQDVPSSSPSDPDSEPTLFIPEQSTAAKDKGKGKKKKVSFEPTPPAVALPKFLYQDSMLREQIAPNTPRLSGTRVTELQVEAAQLGNAQVRELHEIEREYTAWWKKKTAQIASALGAD